ncbi:hypothetical protein [Streptomyces himalayensis]|uniref:Secreted protein n=1 Tax=Streptomyces himalayensis subsp. himalayensis TaxID=2756131 RepID=A0A7W0DSF9_9ACTN|nr:hypothetical protein [Streptomyces himalayensis]MBA2950407.1 hypothetical protein [Streptomyces himalayensis subsp. himalayensis]
MDNGAICRIFGRGSALGTAVLTATVLLTLAGPGSGTAEAAALCPGRKVRTLPFSTGDVRVYKSRGYLCAVTFAKRPGTRKQMSVSVQARGSRPVRDSGRYTHHAGPVTVHAGHRCVWIKGAVGSGSVSSGWILC